MELDETQAARWRGLAWHPGPMRQTVPGPGPGGQLCICIRATPGLACPQCPPQGDSSLGQRTLPRSWRLSTGCPRLRCMAEGWPSALHFRRVLLGTAAPTRWVQSGRSGRGATPEEGGQSYEEVLCHRPNIKDRRGGTAKVTQDTCSGVCTASHGPPTKCDMPKATWKGAAGPKGPEPQTQSGCPP